MTWALVDGCFVVADVLSLAALQPEGVVAAEAARSRGQGRRPRGGPGRSAASWPRRPPRSAARPTAAREGAEATAERLSRWWAVRLAGGTYPLLRRLPEALARLSLGEIARPGPPALRQGRPAAEHLGARSGSSGTASAVLQAIPAERGLKYVAAQVVQAGVGVVALPQDGRASRLPTATTLSDSMVCGFHAFRDLGTVPTPNFGT